MSAAASRARGKRKAADFDPLFDEVIGDLIDGPESPPIVTGQNPVGHAREGLPVKLEDDAGLDGAASIPAGRRMVDGVDVAVPPVHASGRPSRRLPAPDFTLADFPPLQSKVLVRRDGGRVTMELVLRHTQGQLVVQPEGDDVETLVSLLDVNALKRRHDPVRELLPVPTTAAAAAPANVAAAAPSAPAAAAPAAPASPAPAAPAAPAPASAEAPVARRRLTHLVKIEDEEHSQMRYSQRTAPKDARTLEREALRAKYQVTPEGEPRKTFRAGCHAKSLTQALGGNGCDMDRFAKDMDHYTSFDDLPPRPLVMKGELYMWGSANWNPWAPSFAGDSGLYLYPDFSRILAEKAREMKWSSPQVEFHLFRQCTEREHLQPYSAWHGKEARKKTIYCGVYCVDEETPPQMIKFKEFPPYTQQAHAELNFRRAEGRPPNEAELAAEEQQLLQEPAFGTRALVDAPQADGHITNADGQAGRQVTVYEYGVEPGQGLPYSVEWIGEKPSSKSVETVTSVEARVGGTVTLSSGRQFKNPPFAYTMYPVRFVRYDEDVYRQLLHIGANNGQVEVDDSKLGPL